jgi:hypothetical protein
MLPMPTHPVRRRWPGLVALVLLVASLVAAARPQSPESRVIAWARAATWDGVHLDNSAIVLDTVPADVPALVRLLTGCDYLLTHQPDGTWRVDALMSTWVA